MFGPLDLPSSFLLMGLVARPRHRDEQILQE